MGGTAEVSFGVDKGEGWMWGGRRGRLGLAESVGGGSAYCNLSFA